MFICRGVTPLNFKMMISTDFGKIFVTHFELLYERLFLLILLFYDLKYENFYRADQTKMFCDLPD